MRYLMNLYLPSASPPFFPEMIASADSIPPIHRIACREIDPIPEPVKGDDETRE
jgi:hypothetical protein